MTILIPFKALAERFPELSEVPGARGKLRGTLLGLIKIMLCSVAVDDAWYREKYPDVAAAIDSGDYESAHRHFIEHGYFEGRMPSRLNIDETWYLLNYDDIAEGVESGDIPSAEEHFNEFGYAEGRLPLNPPAWM